MPETLFSGIFDTAATTVIPVGKFLLCMAVALVIGGLLAGAYMLRSRYTKSFVITLGLLPCVVCVVIMMVNGNIGAGVAVAGAFSLVRFRSVPGSAREIVMLFLAMGAGLITGMGYLAYGLLFTLVMGGVSVICNLLKLGAGAAAGRHKTLHITIPEDLDYPKVFDEILDEYASSWELVKVKTTNMGSLFRLSYQLTLREPAREKELIDRLRCRNGNLEISLTRQETTVTEL